MRRIRLAVAALDHKSGQILTVCRKITQTGRQQNATFAPPSGNPYRPWVAMEQWKVLIKDRLPAYITWDQYRIGALGTASSSNYFANSA
jgi:hypothetical protein